MEELFLFGSPECVVQPWYKVEEGAEFQGKHEVSEALAPA